MCVCVEGSSAIDVKLYESLGLNAWKSSYDFYEAGNREA